MPVSRDPSATPEATPPLPSTASSFCQPPTPTNHFTDEHTLSHIHTHAPRRSVNMLTLHVQHNGVHGGGEWGACVSQNVGEELWLLV